MTDPAHPPGGAFELLGRPVARIGFGVMQLTPHGAPALDASAGVALLRRARELGVGHVDTAEFYGPAVANQLIRAAYHPYPPDLVIATKVGADVDGAGRLVPAQRPQQLRASLEANLRSLGTERVGIVNLRRLDRPPGIIAGGDQRVDLDSQLAELVALRDEGKLGAIGLSNVDAGQVRQALAAGIVCVQNAYSLLNRSAEPVLDLSRAHGLGWVPFFPLGSAFPNQPKVTADPTVRAVADELGATPAQVGLAWQLRHAPQTLLIPGTGSLAHLEQNCAAGDVRLTRVMTERLDALSRGA